jgi:hypothetical protein
MTAISGEFDSRHTTTPRGAVREKCCLNGIRGIILINLIVVSDYAKYTVSRELEAVGCFFSREFARIQFSWQ